MITFTAEIDLEDIRATVIASLIPSLKQDVLEIEVTANLEPCIPANTGGPPDTWCPAEGGGIEDWSAEFTDPTTGGKHKFDLDNWLTDAAVSRIEEQVYKEAENN